MTPKQKAKLKKADADKRTDYHIFKCLTCTDTPEFDGIPKFLVHLKQSHHIVRHASEITHHMQSHLDATKYYETQYAGEVDGVNFADVERNERTGEDALWWMDIG